MCQMPGVPFWEWTSEAWWNVIYKSQICLYIHMLFPNIFARPHLCLVFFFFETGNFGQECQKAKAWHSCIQACEWRWWWFWTTSGESQSNLALSYYRPLSLEMEGLQLKFLSLESEWLALETTLGRLQQKLFQVTLQFYVIIKKRSTFAW